MPTDHADHIRPEPWPRSTYGGFAGPAAAAREPAHDRSAAPTARRPSRNMLLAGVGGAVALGLVLGLVARPQMSGGGPKPAPMRAVTAPSPGATIPVEVMAPSVVPAPKAVGRLEVLPPDMAAAASGPRAAPANPPPMIQTPRAVILPPPPIAAQARGPARAPSQASFDCSGARPGAERVVCGDPQLARADRQLSRAYQRALGSGVDPRALRDEQRDWLSIREDAARQSPRAVASIYEQRIDELNALADEAGEQ